MPRFLFLSSLFLTLNACAQGPAKPEIATGWYQKPDRLLADQNPLQGWEIAKKIPPVVGTYDVIYYEDQRPSRARSREGENCAYADGPDRSIVVCDKNVVRGRTDALRSVGPTQAM